MKLEFSRQIFDKSLQCESNFFPYGRKDKHDETSIRFSQFYELA